MSLGKTIVGLATYKGAIAGLELQDVTYGEAGSTIEPIAESGNIDGISVYGKKKTIAANGNVRDGADLKALTIGGALTVDSVEYTITGVTVKESITGPKTFSVNGEAPYSVATEATE